MGRSRKPLNYKELGSARQCADGADRVAMLAPDAQGFVRTKHRGAGNVFVALPLLVLVRILVVFRQIAEQFGAAGNNFLSLFFGQNCRSQITVEHAVPRGIR